MAKWTVTFVSKSHTKYKIEIDGASGNSDIALIPAENPFVTEEEGKDDLFVPVKTQSGYVSVITDDLSLARDIIPIEGGVRSVAVYIIPNTSSPYVVWRGYVQPKMLSMNIWNGKTKLNIPVECPLSAMKYYTFNYTLGKISIAQVLSKIIPQDVYELFFQGSMLLDQTDTNKSDKSWFLKKCYVILFYGMTIYKVLENICIFFGWTCRYEGESLYFISYRNVDAYASRTILYTNTQDLANGYDINIEVPWQEQDLLAETIADNKTKMIFTNGVKSMSVKCGLDSFDQSIDSPDDAFKTEMNNLTFPHHYIDTSYWVDETLEIQRGYYDGFTNFAVTNGNQHWILSGYNIDYNLNKNGSLVLNDWTYRIIIKCSPWIALDHELAPSQQRSVVGYYRGWLELELQEDVSFPEGTLTFSVKPQDYWAFAFFISIGNLTCDNTMTWNQNPNHPINIQKSADEDSASIDIPIPASGLNGKLKIKFVTYDLYDYSTSFEWFNVSFKSKEDADVNEGLSEVVHSVSTEMKFKNEKTIESALCVKEKYLQNSQNFLLNRDESVCAQLFDYASSTDYEGFNPLQRVADEGASELSKVGEMLEHNVLSDRLEKRITPLTVFYSEDLDSFLYPVSVGRNWRYDIAKLRLVKRIFSGQ